MEHKFTPLQSGDLQIVKSTEVSIINGKMAAILGGDGGAFCHYCHATKEGGKLVS